METSDIKHFKPKTVKDYDKRKVYSVLWKGEENEDSGDYYDARIYFLAGNYKSSYYYLHVCI